MFRLNKYAYLQEFQLWQRKTESDGLTKFYCSLNNRNTNIHKESIECIVSLFYGLTM